MRSLIATVTLSAAVLLTGCGFTADKALSTTSPATGMHGKLMGGQQPVANSVVTVWAIGNGVAATALASTTTDASGSFEFGTTPANTFSCGTLIASAAVPATSAAPASIHSKVPVVHPPSKITLTPAWPGAINGRPAVMPTISETYVYLTAAGGDAGSGMNSSIYLVAGAGKCIDALTATIEINEVTTVVFATAMQNFYGSEAITTNGDPLQENAVDIADTNTLQTILDPSTGTVQPNTVSTTGTSITIDATKIYSFANTIASCVNSADDTSVTPSVPSSACQTLFSTAVTPTASSTDTFVAAFYMAIYPYSNVVDLYKLAGSKPPFIGLPSAPNDWTIGVSYTTAAMGLGLFPSAAGSPSSSTIDIDSSGRVWFPSNKSGGVGVGFFDPTENAFNGPYGGTDLVAPQYIALDDPSSTAYVTDLAAPKLVGFDTTQTLGGTVTDVYTLNGTGGTTRPDTGPIFVNSDSSIVLSFEDAFSLKEVVYLGSKGVYPENDLNYAPTGLTLDTIDGSDPNDVNFPSVVAATSNSTSFCDFELSSAFDGYTNLVASPGACSSGGAATAQFYDATTQDEVAIFTTTNAFCSKLLGSCVQLPEYLNNPQGVAVDGDNEVWVANSGDGSIYPLVGGYNGEATAEYDPGSDRAYLHGVGNGGTMTAPVGIAVDRSGNVWASNANCLSPTDITCVYTLSEVIGIGYSTYTPLADSAARLQGTDPNFATTPELGQGVRSEKRRLKTASSSSAHQALLKK